MMIMMAMTIAKTGRSMKNRAMLDYSLFSAQALHSLSGKGSGRTATPGPHRQQSFDNHTIAGTADPAR